MFAFARLVGRLLIDRMHGPVSGKQLGIRLRKLFVEMGGAAVKIGQQLSVRIDMLPYSLCRELEALVDSIPPIPVEEAIDILERGVGKKRNVERIPLDELFESFDPEPIGSASIACVYLAVLFSGKKVAVKIRRPGIEASIAADLGVINFATRALEVFSLVRNGFFANLRVELRTMLSEELDFSLEARYQRLFRYYTKRDRLKWVTSPKVFTRYCTHQILVSEYVTGFWCTEILAAQENDDIHALAELKARRITPKKVGRRLMEYSFWSRYEALFFHADPHHGNIAVADGCKLIFVDFGSCGTTSRQARMSQLMMMDRMSHNDISGTVEAGIATLEPLPPLDVYSLKKALESEFAQWLYAFRDKKSEWWERTTAGLWLVMLTETRKRQIPVGLETVRLARSLLLIDTLCFRLDRDMVSPDAFVKYERGAMRRGARRVIARIQKTPLSYYSNTLIKEGDDALARLRFVAWQVERMVETYPKEFAATLTKMSAFAVQVLRIGRFVAGVVAAVYVYVWLTGRHPQGIWQAVSDILRSVVLKPVSLIVLLLLAIRYYRRIRFRTEDVDVERRWPRR